MLRRIRKRRAFWKDQGALAAVEFAFIAPVMILMLFGMMELTLALNARSKVASVASTLGDLVAQSSALSQTDLANVMNAANSIMYPTTTLPSLRVFSVVGSGSASSGKIAWICTRTGTGTFSPLSRAKGNNVDLPKPLLGASGDSVIMVEVAYAHSSPTLRAFWQERLAKDGGKILMRDTYYAKPRRVTAIPEPVCPT